MKKQMCLAALCLLAVAGGCAKIPETEPGGNTRENAATAAMPVDGENHLYTLSAETPQGLFNIKGGGGQYFLDYAAAENRPLCTVPGCTHTGEDCAACLPEGTYGMFLYPLADGSLVYGLQDDSSYSFWRMDGDGGNRQELARMASENVTWNFLCADEESLYLSCVTYGDGEQFAVSRLPLTGGTMETLWSKTEYTAPELLGVNGRDLVLLWYDWSERETVPPADTTEDMPWEEIRERMAAYDAEMAKVTGKFRVTFCCIDTGEEQAVDAWTSNYGSAGRTLYWDRDRLYWFDCEEPGPLHWVTAAGQTGKLAVDWPQEIARWQGDLYIYLECRMLQDKMLLTVSETQGTDPVVSLYALDMQTGALREIPLQYIANAKEQPVSIEGQGEDCLFVTFEEQVQMGSYLDPDGVPATSMKTHRRWGLISPEDFLAGLPNYREVQMDRE